MISHDTEERLLMGGALLFGLLWIAIQIIAIYYCIDGFNTAYKAQNVPDMLWWGFAGLVVLSIGGGRSK